MLREENNILSRRQRAKETRLRQGGSLTIAEAEDLQSQREATAQIKEETRQRSGRRPRTKTGQRRYSVYRNTGHNTRTCQFVKETSNEEVSEYF
ncbi:transposase [Colletotrichum musicola]|uniref:Transposase n=1 Tax=Colletotrichum musicola TaxID=2175873 RepID=A0A8H6JHM1_9PEZI|nr:transposase [Colletotrichum musicola]